VISQSFRANFECGLGVWVNLYKGSLAYYLNTDYKYNPRNLRQNKDNSLKISDCHVAKDEVQQ